MTTYCNTTDNFSALIAALAEELTSLSRTREVTYELDAFDYGQPVATLRINDDNQCWTGVHFDTILKRCGNTAYFAVMPDIINKGKILIYIYKRNYGKTN